MFSFFRDGENSEMFVVESVVGVVACGTFEFLMMLKSINFWCGSLSVARVSNYGKTLLVHRDTINVNMLAEITSTWRFESDEFCCVRRTRWKNTYLPIWAANKLFRSIVRFVYIEKSHETNSAQRFMAFWQTAKLNAFSAQTTPFKSNEDRRSNCCFPI